MAEGDWMRALPGGPGSVLLVSGGTITEHRGLARPSTPQRLSLPKSVTTFS